MSKKEIYAPLKDGILPPSVSKPNKDFIEKYITNLVPIEKISSKDTNYNFILDKRQAKKKEVKTRERKTYITRREKNALGLTKVGRNDLKYEDVLPLHQLWSEYIREVLRIQPQKVSIPSYEDRGWDSFSSHLTKADYHGAIFTVVRSQCPSHVGLSGICVMDTKELLVLVGKDNITRKIPKKQSVFELSIFNGIAKVVIFGKHMAIRSAERSTKKIKQTMTLDL